MLDALGFDAVFDSSILSFEGFSADGLFADWQVMSAQLIAPGRVRVGGFDANGVNITSQQSLATLRFSTLQSAGCGNLTLEAFVDDIAQVAPCSSSVTWETSTTGYPDNGFIGVFADSLGENCCLTVGADQKLWIVAQLEGRSGGGIAGAEFRIEIDPPAPDATFEWTPSANVDSSVGDPVDNASLGEENPGVRMTLTGCNAESRIILGTLRVTNLVGAHDFVVRRHSQPTLLGSECAQFIPCEGADCAAICLAATRDVEDDPAVFRSPANAGCDVVDCGFVAVQDLSWGLFKTRYR